MLAIIMEDEVTVLNTSSPSLRPISRSLRTTGLLTTEIWPLIGRVPGTTIGSQGGVEVFLVILTGQAGTVGNTGKLDHT